MEIIREKKMDGQKKTHSGGEMRNCFEAKDPLVHTETEIKLLVEMPEDRTLENWSRGDLVQTYLTNPEVMERVRSWTENGVTCYTHTIKQGSGISHLEREEEISRETYEALLERADPQRVPVVKTRCRLNWQGFCYELDIYPQWTRQAVLEVELERVDLHPALPPGIRMIRDVTFEDAYSNSSMALRMPTEEGRQKVSDMCAGSEEEP